jgi:hypothetical protein
MLDKLADALGGSVVQEVAGLVRDYFPPEMPADKRAELEMRMRELEMRKRAQVDAALAESERMITERVATLEGSAQDLRAIPIVGPLTLFVRGLQRPIWGYGVMYADLQWFSGQWQLEQQAESAMWVINLLVLGFLFGERAVQNLAPLISEVMSKRK